MFPIRTAFVAVALVTAAVTEPRFPESRFPEPRFVQRSPRADPRTLIDSSIAAMSGSVRLAELRSLRIQGFQHEYLLGNAERAEGPFRVNYGTFDELRELIGARIRRTESARNYWQPEGSEWTSVLDDSVLAVRRGEREMGSSPSAYDDLAERLDASPERALLLASRATALRNEGVVTRFGIVHDVLSFPWRGGRMRLELSRETRLPTAVETVRAYPDDFRRAPFGDVTVRTEYENWEIDGRGFWWPRQHTTTLNGEPLRDVTVTALALDAPAPRDSFAIGDSARVQFARAARSSFRNFSLGMGGEATELRSGIVRLPDFWAMTLVRQDDGVVIFEAHVSGSYLRQVIAEAKRRWPEAPVKAIVLTSDPWAHIGGVREAMALGIPIYVNGRSVPFFTKLARAPHTLEPDALAKSPRTPKLVAVTRKTVIGSGVNRIELYPVGGPYAERMTMAYFPEHRLLYGADLVFRNRGGAGYMRTPATDLRRAVEREGLVVDTVFCVQRTAPVAYGEFVAGE